MILFLLVLNYFLVLLICLSTGNTVSRVSTDRTYYTTAGSSMPSGNTLSRACDCSTCVQESVSSPTRPPTFSSTTPTSVTRTCLRAGTTTGAGTSSCSAARNTTCPTTTSVPTCPTSPHSCCPRGSPIWANTSRRSASTSAACCSNGPDLTLN